jgi:hypothetical protein
MAKHIIKMHRPATHNFRRVKYQIKWRRPKGQPKTCGGTCDPPNARIPTIEIDPKLSEFNTLRVMIDESIHACLWDIDNDSVDEASTSIAYWLWKCGVRFTERKDKPTDIRQKI